MRRFVIAFLTAASAALGVVVTADAHALPQSSTPAAGATLAHAPSQVTITFSERPDPALSIIHVYNSGGQKVEHGHAQAVPGDPATLTVSLPQLPDGIYTVSWVTVSAVDGHYASGAFAFGVGATPTNISPVSGTRAPGTPGPAPLGVAGKWIYYVGLALLVGGTWISLFAFRRVLGRLLAMAGVGVAASLLGLLLSAESQRETAGVSWADFASSSLSGNLIKQIVPVVAAGIALGVAWRTRGRRQENLLGTVALIVLVGIALHTLTTHADASHVAWLMLPAQWVHLTAFTVWIGGLAALLIGARGLAPGAAAGAVRRFSLVAGFALAAIGISGGLRAIDEVGTLSRLTSTLFGRLVLVKVALFLLLVALGAINRYRNVPRAEWNLRGLRNVGRTEIGVAMVVIAVAAVLTSLAPPSYTPVAAASASQQITAFGQDPGTLYKTELIVAPGYPGSNRFTVKVTDYETGKPSNINGVSLRFDFPGRPSIGESQLTLRRSGYGQYSATGTNLSLAGRWAVTAVIEAGLNSAEVPMIVTTAEPPERITVQHNPGIPDIYTVDFGGGKSVNLYVDSKQAGFYNVHATFFNGQNEMPVADGTVISATPERGETLDLAVTRVDAGHVIGEGSLAPGKWRFDVTASGLDGSSYHASFEEALK